MDDDVKITLDTPLSVTYRYCNDTLDTVTRPECGISLFFVCVRTVKTHV